MLPRRALPIAAAIMLSLSPLGSAFAQMSATTDTAASEQKATGLWLLTDYPELTAQIGNEAKISLTLQNSNLPPERVALSVEGLPDGWTWKLNGGGREISAAMVGTNETRGIQLSVTPPADAKTDDGKLPRHRQGAGSDADASDHHAAHRRGARKARP